MKARSAGTIGIAVSKSRTGAIEIGISVLLTALEMQIGIGIYCFKTHNRYNWYFSTAASKSRIDAIGISILLPGYCCFKIQNRS